MIVANFNKGTTISQIFGLWQYDYGQVLRIQGLNLPTAVEIHFSYQRTGGESKTRIGMTKDGVTDVVIPDSMLENSDTNQDYKIYAFVYVTDDSSGQTEYCLTMNVQSRPKPEAFECPEDGEIFNQAIQAVRESADQAAESARQAELIKDSVQDMVDAIGSIDEQVQEVKRYAEQSKTASTNAALSESKAKESEEAAEMVRQEVAKNKTAIEQAVSGFDGKVVQANTVIENAKTQAVKAVADKGAEILQSFPPDFETQMENKVDKQQGIDNKGKALVVGEDGNVVVGEVQSGGGNGIAIINTMIGASPLVVPDSAERVNKGFVLTGNTEQLQTTGANLIPFPYTDKSMTKNGVAFEVQLDGGVEIHGTATEGVTFFLSTLDYGNNSIFNNGTGNGKILSGGKDGVKIEYHGINKKLYLGIEKGQTVNTVIYPQLQNGSNATPYEPYTGGKPSPSPEYPQEITNVGEWNEKTHKYEIDVKITNAEQDYDKEQTLTLASDRPITKWDKLVEQDGQIGWLYGGKIIESYNSDPIDTEYMSSIGELSVGATVLYKIKIAEFVPLPQSEQEAIRALKTYYPTTVITAEGGEVDPNIEVTYMADTKNYIDNKLKDINTALVNTQKALL